MQSYRHFLLLFGFFFLRLSLFAQVNLTQSNLPIVIMDTHGQEIPDDPKITVDMKIIYNGEGKVNSVTDTVYHYNSKVGIELRGSSSQMFPKKPYGFETLNTDSSELEVKLLGMPKESDWTFNATYNDKTLMRDALAYTLAGTFMDYAPRLQYCELIIDGDYKGIYMLIEKIKRGKNRVNIAKMSASDNSGDALTGGYIIKIDKMTGTNSGEGWESKYAPIPGSWQTTFFQFEYPKNQNITQPQRDYIHGYIDQLEDVLQSAAYKDSINGYRKYIDTKSLADYIIVNELTKNVDAYRLSTFFYKQRDSEGGKIKFGPVWDYNLGLGNVDYCTGGNSEGLVINDFNEVCPGDGWVIHFWWKRFLEDSTFQDELKLRWNELRHNQLSGENIFGLIDSLSKLLDVAKDRNFERWPVLGQYVWHNYFVGNTYGEEIDFLKGWLTDRLAYLDEVWQINTSKTLTTSTSQEVIAYPNPFTSNVTIRHDMVSVDATLTVTDIQGRVIHVPIASKGQSELRYDFSTCPAGVYFIRLMTSEGVRTCRVVKH